MLANHRFGPNARPYMLKKTNPLCRKTLFRRNISRQGSSLMGMQLPARKSRSRRALYRAVWNANAGYGVAAAGVCARFKTKEIENDLLVASQI
jgi:hypothetical protein